LRAEDLVVALGDMPVTSAGDLQLLMTEDLIGTPVEVVVIREGRELTLELVPAELEVQ
jgi:S1-C subfamily serine protease